jgi:predicted RNase H-like HicB family nuclease
MRYAMIIEKGERNYSAYLPDLPGCIATGKSLEEVKQRMKEAVELHLRGMREDGIPNSGTDQPRPYAELALRKDQLVPLHNRGEALRIVA